MALRFEWDTRKEAANWRKHSVRFADAATVLGDPLSVTVADPDHSSGRNERFVTIGMSSAGRLLIMVHTERGDTIRIISARKATASERRNYEEGK